MASHTCYLFVEEDGHSPPCPVLPNPPEEVSSRRRETGAEIISLLAGVRSCTASEGLTDVLKLGGHRAKKKHLAVGTKTCQRKRNKE